MNTLTDRYVWAAVRAVPEAQRAEFGRELRERIGDELDARTEQGIPPADAERATLVELGDPAALAANYVDRPLHLIGPRYFLTWKRLLTMLFTIVLPIAVGAIVLAEALSGAPIGEIIGSAISSGISIAAHLAFWTTLVFAIIERSPGTKPLAEWTPEMLPQVRDDGRAGRAGDLIASIVFLFVFAGAIIWQQFASPVTDASGDPVPVLDPALWSFWLPYFLVLLMLEVLFAVAVYLWGWNWWLVAANVVLNIAFTVPAVWLFTSGQLVNPAYLDEVGWPWGEAGQIVSTVIVVLIVTIAIWDIVDGVLKTVRGRGGSALAVGRI